MAREYIDLKMVGDGKADTTVKKAQWFLEQLEPAIGSMPIADVDPQMLLAALKRLEAKGVHETAKRCRSFASRVFRCAIATSPTSQDPAWALRGVLTTPTVKRHSAILDPEELGGLLRAIDTFQGQPLTKLAFQLTPHVFVRPGMLRKAEWSEFDLENATWSLTEGRMKMRRPHLVPLSRQALEILRSAHVLSSGRRYVFSSLYPGSRPCQRTL